MARAGRILVPVLLLAILLPGCAAIQQLASLRAVTFAFTGVSDVRLAGIPLAEGVSFSSLSIADAGRLGAAVVSRSVPLELVAHVGAANPAANRVPARLTALDWTLFVEDRRMLSGGLAGPVALEPGRSIDVPLAVRLDLLQLGGGGARDLFDLALAVAGIGPLRKDLSLRLAPTVETSLGPIAYPASIVLHRATATH